MCRVELCPGVDNWEDLGGLEVGEREIVGGCEGDYIAFPCYGLGAEEDGGEAYRL